MCNVQWNRENYGETVWAARVWQSRAGWSPELELVVTFGTRHKCGGQRRYGGQQTGSHGRMNNCATLDSR